MSTTTTETKIEDNHHSAFDYPTWGLAENTDLFPAEIIMQLSIEKIATAVGILTKHVNLTGYALKNSGGIKHYQGKNLDALQLVWLRFERADKKNNGIMGEHISATIDVAKHKIMGFTRMQAELLGDAFVSHQLALTKAIEFLKLAAADLVPHDVVIPEINSLHSGSRYEFSPELKIGNVEVHWIDDHKEDLIIEAQPIAVHGMKVKMFIPLTNLWAWVIVDKNGEIETFERNIFWNFKEFRRETQMFLHDKWLDAQGIFGLKQMKIVK